MIFNLDYLYYKSLLRSFKYNVIVISKFIKKSLATVVKTNYNILKLNK